MDVWDLIFYFTYLGILIAVVAAIGLPLIQAMGNPGALKKIGIAVGAIVVLFILCYLLAGNNTYGLSVVSPGESKIVGAGILMFYALLLTALVSIVYTEVQKMIK